MNAFKVVLAVAAVCLGLVAVEAADTSAAPLNEKEKATHALNRLGYGPRPGEAERVAELGVEKWIRAQLEPAAIADEKASARVAELEYIQKSPKELVQAYQAEIRARQQAQRAKAAAGDEMKKTGAAAPAGPGESELIVAQALGELHHAKLVRAVYSDRQLEQVLVDFWFNHFNVDARKQQVRATVVSYEQDVIRPNIWGDFRDLLGATAKSSAMLVYLDNWRSSVAYEPDEMEMRMVRRVQKNTVGMTEEELAAQPKPTRGLNENYGRELMELHTLGVDAGYTQKDVQEVARAFTGWTIMPTTGEFQFRPRWHDQGEKIVLGKTLTANGGLKDGEQVLDMLATHPATARHIAYKLCQRFVADAPPEDLVKRVAEVFLKTGGNLKSTYEALFLDREFFSPAHYGAKTKSPYEFAVSALRASGAEFVEVKGIPSRIPLRALEAGALLGRGQERLARAPRKTVTMHIAEMGQANYGWGPPTGFPEDSSTWVNSGALVSRLNYALALTGGQVADARVHPRALLGGKDADMAAEAVDAMARSLFARPLGEATRRVILAQGGAGAADAMSAGAPPVVDVPKVLALMLGAPEFQRR